MSLAFHQQFEGEMMDVLWETSVGANSHGLCWVGYTDNYIRVHGQGPADLFNTITPTMLENARADGMNGRVQDAHDMQT
jgi:hypothetical protein